MPHPGNGQPAGSGNGTPKHNGASAILVVSDEPDVAFALEVGLPNAPRVLRAQAPSDTAGIGVEIVVIASSRPLLVSETRVHPNLCDKPIVVFAPGSGLREYDWSALDTHVVDDEINALEELFRRVLELIARQNNGRSPHTNGDRQVAVRPFNMIDQPRPPRHPDGTALPM